MGEDRALEGFGPATTPPMAERCDQCDQEAGPTDRPLRWVTATRWVHEECWEPWIADAVERDDRADVARAVELAEPEAALRVADRILEAVLPELELLTGEGWQLAYGQAIHEGRIHTAWRIRRAKELSMYRGRDRGRNR